MFYVLCTLQVAAIIIMFVEFLYIFTYWSSKQQSYLLLAILFCIINTVGYTLIMLSTNADASLSACKFSYFGKTYVGLMLFLFVAGYCHVRIPQWMVMLLMAYQTFSWILVLTCEYHTLFYTDMQFVESGLFSHIEYTHGLFYYLFVVMQGLYFLTAIGFALHLYKTTHLPKTKQQARWLFILLIIAMAGSVAAMLGVVEGYDLTNLSYCVGTFLLFALVMRYHLLETVDAAKDYIIDHVPSGILITDDQNNMIYSNQLVQEVLSGRECPAGNAVMPDFFHEENLFYANKVYQVEEQHLRPFKNELVGIYLLHDITDSYYFQEKLKEEVERQTKEAQDRRQQVEHLSIQMVETLASAIDAKDPYTKGHSVRAAGYATLLAQELGYQGTELVRLRYAALLHDIGKISVPDSVLNKPSHLTDIEYAVIKSHTVVGGDILKKIDNMPEIAIAARYHHERYDGKGYPEGLAGKDIPEIARIISIVDSYDAMNSKRVYRNSLTKDKIRAELKKGRGSQFDPTFLDAYLRLFDRGALDPVELLDNAEGYAKEPENILHENTGTEEGEEIKRDFLTGLRLYQDRETEIPEKMQMHSGALAIIDVDNLKLINDTMGHLAGDHLIRSVGQLLSRYENRGIVLRQGGDRFLFFVPDVDITQVQEMMESVTDDFKAVGQEDALLRQVSLSIGISMNRAGDDYHVIYNKADKALYYVKLNGKNGIHIYDTDDGDRHEAETNVDLEKLVQSLKTSGNYEGALDVEYDMFARLYEYTQNMGERYQHNFELVMITLDTEHGLEIDEIEKAMQCMSEAIQRGIRNVDIYTRYSGVQFLIILMDAAGSEVQMITDRIFGSFYKRYHGRGVRASYHVTEDIKK